MKYGIILSVYLLLAVGGNSQRAAYEATVVAFYNCENLYDTIHDPAINDLDFTPGGTRMYTRTVYLEKISHLAAAISQIGTELVPGGLVLAGLAEVENDNVLYDLVADPALAAHCYRFVHYDSRDPRGVDVALLYDPRYFHVTESRAIPVWLPAAGIRSRYTRDILFVKGSLDGESIYIYVNHWPSRLGGEEKTMSSRAAAAAACRTDIDDLLRTDPAAKIIVMGDLNDDPVNGDIIRILKSKGSKNRVNPGEFFNPWADIYQDGIGTLAYGDTWNLFDQILFGYTWLNKAQTGFFYYRSYVFNKPLLAENAGRQRGHPMRSWLGNTYHGGYSDHFPVFSVLLRRTPP